jgi:hypothetical protein
LWNALNCAGGALAVSSLLLKMAKIAMPSGHQKTNPRIASATQIGLGNSSSRPAKDIIAPAPDYCFAFARVAPIYRQPPRIPPRIMSTQSAIMTNRKNHEYSIAGHLLI